MSYGKTIRERRKSLGWTQMDLAERVNASPTTISNWEREVTRPGLTDIDTLARALEMSPEVLLGELDVRLTPPAVAKLPRRLVQALLLLSPEDQRTILRLARALRGMPDDPEEQDG